MSKENRIYPGDKVMSLADALEWRESLRRQGIKLAVTNGCFDLLHRGHVEYLDSARNAADALLVLVSSALPSAVCVLNPLFALAVVFSVINRCIYPPSKSCSRRTLVTVSTWGAKTCCHAPVKMIAFH